MRLRGPGREPFADDDRAVVVQVGAVLLFAILVLVLSLYQAQVVPAQNEAVEFNHNQRVQDDLVGVRNAVLRAGVTGHAAPAAIELGTAYPERVFFVNPPRATGRLHSTPLGALTLSNVTAVDDETADYLDDSGTYAFETTGLVYVPDYHEYRNAPVVGYEHGLLYTALLDDAGVYDRFVTALAGQQVVRNRTLTFVVLDGNLSASGVRAESVDPEALSVATSAVLVRNETGNVTVTLPTRLDAATWAELLATQMTPAGHVREVESVAGRDAVRLVLEPGTYRLRMAKVGVGEGYDDPAAHYLTDVESRTRTGTRGRSRLVVEVRDRYNNPVAGANVTFVVTDGDGVLENESRGAHGETYTVTAGEDGHAVVWYNASNPGARVNVTAYLGSTVEESAPEREEVAFSFEAVTEGGGLGEGGVGGAINPNSTDGVVLDDATITDAGCSEATTNCHVATTLENLDANHSRTIARARLNFYSIDRQASGASSRTPPEYVVLDGTTLRSASNGGSYQSVGNITIPAGGTETLDLYFYASQGDEFDVKVGDFFVISVIFENGETATYFVAPSSS